MFLTREARAPAALKLGPQRRTFTLVREGIDEAARTVPLAFSSEEPYERWFGIEILGHAPGECDLSWLKGGTAQVLSEHDTRQPIGIVASAAIGSDRTGRAVVRFGKSELAEREFRDVLDGIRANVSVGYEVLEFTLTGEKEGVKTYRATKWRPLEISLVSIPADMTVGVGRADAEREPQDVPIKTQEDDMFLTRNAGDPAPAAPNPAPVPAAPAATPRAPDTAALLQAERERIRQITELGARHNRRDLADKAVADGLTLDQFKGVMLDAIPAGTRLYTPPTEIGMSPREARSFNLARAIIAHAYPQDAGIRAIAGLELAACQAVREKMEKLGRAPRGFFVPMDAQDQVAEADRGRLAGAREIFRALMQRDLTVGTPTAGGNLVGTDFLAGSFIDLLRNRMLVATMGATMLPGLVGNVAIPKQTAAATGAWVAENAAPSEGAQTFGQLTLSPKTASAFVDFSRQLLLQSAPAIDQLVRADLMAVLALMVDLAALHGSGSGNQPTGIAATAGIGSVAGGTNGAAPTWAHIVDLETQVAVANADVGAVGYLTNAKVRGKLKTTEKAASTAQFVWGDNQAQPGMGMLNGYKAGVSNQVSSTLTKGTASGICSAIFFGNWSDLVVGEWGILDILTDPYTGSSAGTVRVTAFQSIDIGVRRATSFAAMLDALTA